MLFAVSRLEKFDARSGDSESKKEGDVDQMLQCSLMMKSDGVQQISYYLIINDERARYLARGQKGRYVDDCTLRSVW